MRQYCVLGRRRAPRRALREASAGSRAAAARSMGGSERAAGCTLQLAAPHPLPASKQGTQYRGEVRNMPCSMNMPCSIENIHRSAIIPRKRTTAPRRENCTWPNRSPGSAGLQQHDSRIALTGEGVFRVCGTYAPTTSKGERAYLQGS